MSKGKKVVVQIPITEWYKEDRQMTIVSRMVSDPPAAAVTERALEDRG